MTPQQEMAAKYKMFDQLGPLDAYVNKWVSDKNLTVKLRNLLLKNAQDLATAGIPVTENKLMEVLRGTLTGIGEAAAVIPVYAAGGPAAWPPSARSGESPKRERSKERSSAASKGRCCRP